MTKTKTVVVDAAGHARAIAALSSLEGHFDADGKTRLAEQACDAADDLTPIAPTLPAKWGPCETIENSEERIVLKIGWRYYCISDCGMWANKDNRAPEQAGYRFVIPLPIATYLLHTWSNR